MKPQRTALSSNAKDWTMGAYICWKHNCMCNGCDMENICSSITPINKIPHDMKPMKFAVISLLKNIGRPNEEKFENYGNES